MSKLKKVSIISVIAILLMIITTAIVYAWNLGNAKSVNIWVGDEHIPTIEGFDAGNVYCVQHNTILNEGWTNYRVKYHITIEGNNATITNGNDESWSVENKLSNGVMAYIMNEGDNIQSHYYNGPYSIKQYSIWHNTSWWLGELGLYDFPTDGSGTSGYAPNEIAAWNDLDVRAANYANSIGNTTDVNITDKTDKNSVTVNTYKKDNESYLMVGPFKWEFTGDLSSIETYNQNNTLLSDVLYGKYVGTKLSVSKDAKEVIVSDNNFYVLIKEGSDATNIKVKGKVSQTYNTIRAELWLLDGGYFQNLVTADTEDKPHEVQVEVEGPEIELLGNIEIIKKDYDTESKLDQEVEFIVKRVSNGKYLLDTYEYVFNTNNQEDQMNGTHREWVYVDKKESATKFKTWQGTIKLVDLIAGKYQLEEVSVGGNHGYTTDPHNIFFVPEGKNVKVPASSQPLTVTATPNTGEITVYNRKNTGNLKIVKKDYKSNENMAYVEFKIKNSDNKYLRVNNKDNVTGSVKVTEESFETDINKATKFITDKKGEINIVDLLVGTYTLEEVSVGVQNEKKGYEVDVNNIYWSIDGSDKKISAATKAITIEVKRQSSDKTSSIEKAEYTKGIVYNEKKYIDLSGFVWEDKPGGKMSKYDDVFHNQKYKDNEGNVHDGNDILKEGITVRLKDDKGNIVKDKNGKDFVAVTDKDGKYKFEYVKISELGKYFVEFEYDGLVYTSVKPLVGEDISVNSKASEVVSQRKTLNSAFTEITNSGSIAERNKGYSRDSQGRITSLLTYDNDVENYRSYLKSSSYNTGLTANTKVTKYSVEDQYKNNKIIVNSEGREEIPYINLGLYERHQPHLSLSNDIETAEVTIKGYTHTYSYAQRYMYVNNKTAFNVAVKFGSNIASTYSRPIYPSDVQYSIDNVNDDANKLKVYVTYSMTIHNNSGKLMVAADEVVNYYDSNYTIVDSYIGDNKNNKVKWNTTSKYGQSYNNNGYVGVYTTSLAGIKIAAGQDLKVYIKFQVNDPTVLGLLNGNATLKNVSEIYSYSSFYGEAKEGCAAGEIYAGIDTKTSNGLEGSAPGNATPGEMKTYENDTDKAPSFILTATGVREMYGKVFEDKTADTLQTGKERNGNGLFDNGERGVAGVKVELITADGNVATIYPNSFVDGKCVANTEGVPATTYTIVDGSYAFRGIEPDKYFVKFTYANGKSAIYSSDGKTKIKDVTAQDYKSTIITSDIIKEAFNKQVEDWFKKDVNSRYSDAKDDYNQRQKVDEQIKTITNTTLSNPNLIKEMYAQTPAFEMGVEYDTTYTASTGVAYTYRINNIDFGLAERPRQSATLEKKISNVKLTLPNGQVLVNGDPRNHLQYVKYVNDDSQLIIEVDSELIEGAELEIKYDLVLTNTSELDYVEESYYYYGIVKNKNNVVKMTSATLVDYVDKELVIKMGNENDGWTMIADGKHLAKDGLSASEMNQLLEQFSTIVETQGIKDKELAPTESATTGITLQRVLGNADELSYENNGEVVTVVKTGGSKLTTEVGSYAAVLLASPETAEPVESDETKASRLAITPPTGENRNSMYLIIGVTSLAVLGAGAYATRKFVKK